MKTRNYGAVIRDELAKDLELAREVRIAEVEQENERLRAALATSKDPCSYCKLPREEMAKCESGFPGCGRADDMMGCPELGARLEVEELNHENTRLREECDKFKAIILDVWRCQREPRNAIDEELWRRIVATLDV